jgi:hypothetical protein
LYEEFFSALLFMPYHLISQCISCLFKVIFIVQVNDYIGNICFY